MKIFIINLYKNIEKRRRITEILDNFESWANIKLNYSFLKAIDGNNINYDNININYFWYDPYSHLHLTKGEVGCALSHSLVWKYFINDYEKSINKNENCIMILEDDFIIENREIFKTIVQLKNINSEFLYLGRKKMVNTEEKVSNLLQNQINYKIVESVYSYWAVAYVINYQGAKRLLETENNFFINNIFPVDEYIPWLYGQKSIYGLKDMQNGNSKFLALEPSIIRPNARAFQNSQTYFSYACPTFRNDILLLTVATEYNDAVKRYVQTANKYGFNPIILALNEEWNGGNMIEGIGGGQKVNMLKKYLKTLKKRKMVIFTDSYDVIVNDNVNRFIDKYQEFYNNKIVFGTECSCWPDEELEEYYPKVEHNNKYLNSGNFIGWSDELLKIMDIDIEDSDDDQLYYTMKFLYSLQNENNICLDYDCKLFLCLNSQYEFKINYEKSCIIKNNNERPNFIHGNGPLSVKRRLNRIANYCTMGWNEIYGYNTIDYWSDELPPILIIYDITNGINIQTKNSIKELEYPEEKLKIIEAEFHLIKFEKINDKYDYEFIFYINSNIILNNKQTLLKLVKENKNVISPMLVKKGEVFSNFWGDIEENNFYKRSEDYLDIVNYKKLGVWNVPYISQCFLMKKKYFNEEIFSKNIDKGEGWDMAMCYNLRLNNIFMWVMNVEKYGIYKEFKSIHNDEAEMDRYVRTILRKDFLENPKLKEIGENILKINIFTEEFCNLVIEKCSNYGDWSKGGEQYFDKRISNIENHPTQDIHLHEINLDRVWGYIVHKYISPLIWDYYKYSTKEINIAFVVKYSMDGQRDLNPHHDASTYTVNICLNNNFEGGGCRFIRQNQSIINKDIGSMIIHPGKLTHYHEGIPITSGKRYILVSFIH
jgi:GR25 family glycosyltransferase involved in LPS biosynthesis